jgi:hypothetical protein
MGYIIIGLVFFSMAIIIYKNVIKKGDVIFIKELRGGLISFAKLKYGQQALFDKRDQTSEVNILWNGAGTAEHSGAKVILAKEGSASNENINLCVAESDWAKNLSSMVRAKTFADLAENELLNTKGLFGMKWQDLILLVIALLLVGTIIVLFAVTPNMVSDAIIESLTSGVLQHAISSVMVGGA